MDDLLLLAPAPAESHAIVLPVGFTDPAGRRHQEASLRKLRGTEEALFYDTRLSGAELVTELLRACLTRLGPVTFVESTHAVRLCSIDRNYILFELRRITFGDGWRAVYHCPACEAAVRVSEDLGIFPIRRLDPGEALGAVTVELQDGYRDRTGAVHRRVVIRFPTGEDEQFVSGLAETDFWQARDALLVRCITEFGTVPTAALEGYGVKILRGLTLGDRRRLQQALDAATPGVDFRRTVQCRACTLEFEAIADITDFFGVT